MAKEEEKAKDATKADDMTVTEVAEVSSDAAVTDYETAQEKGYYGVTTSRLPNEVHLAGSENLRAEIFGAAVNPDASVNNDGPFVVSTKDASSLLGQSLSAPTGTPDAKTGPEEGAK